MPPHNGVHDYVRVRIVNAFGTEKFPLLVEPADEFLEMLRSHLIRTLSVQRLKRELTPHVQTGIPVIDQVQLAIFERTAVGFNVPQSRNASLTMLRKRSIRLNT